uniref:Uncharacterized protein n=1 Tax=Kalanchoe fedtschenkoi TaxID=63787 RepID=A0A7N0VJF2_KALFE
MRSIPFPLSMTFGHLPKCDTWTNKYSQPWSLIKPSCCHDPMSSPSFCSYHNQHRLLN